jgi:hypothetical protein
MYRFKAYLFTLLNFIFYHTRKFHFAVFQFASVMAPVVRIEPNGSQTLLTYDSVTERLTQVQWLPFIQSFRGFNLYVAKEFSQMFDDMRVEFSDVHFQVDEGFYFQIHWSLCF